MNRFIAEPSSQDWWRTSRADESVVSRLSRNNPEDNESLLLVQRRSFCRRWKPRWNLRASGRSLDWGLQGDGEWSYVACANVSSPLMLKIRFHVSKYDHRLCFGNFFPIIWISVSGSCCKNYKMFCTNHQCVTGLGAVAAKQPSRDIADRWLSRVSHGHGRTLPDQIQKRKIAGCKTERITPGVNFTNVLGAAFALVGPKSAKWHCWLDCLFCAFGIYVLKSCT